MTGGRDDFELDIGYPIHHQREGRIEAHMLMLCAPRYAAFNQQAHPGRVKQLWLYTRLWAAHQKEN